MKTKNILLAKAKKIKLLILDVDGVLTNGKIYINDDGSEFKAFHVHDGTGMQKLLQSGVEIAIISGRETKSVTHRMNSLGVKYVYQKQPDKTFAFKELADKLQLNNEDIAYVGDDLPDLVVMQLAGLSIAVANAVESIKKIAHWVTNNNGGKGAVREVCDFIMTAQTSDE